MKPPCEIMSASRFDVINGRCSPCNTQKEALRAQSRERKSNIEGVLLESHFIAQPPQLLSALPSNWPRPARHRAPYAPPVPRCPPAPGERPLDQRRCRHRMTPSRDQRTAAGALNPADTVIVVHRRFALHLGELGHIRGHLGGLH